jgi:hypothetical protein
MGNKQLAENIGERILPLLDARNAPHA